MRGRSTRPHAACVWLSQFLMVLTVGCAGNQSMFNPQGPAARRIADLGLLMIAICLVVYLVVIAVAAWSLLRQRQASDDSAPSTLATEHALSGRPPCAVPQTTGFLDRQGRRRRRHPPTS